MTRYFILLLLLAGLIAPVAAYTANTPVKTMALLQRADVQQFIQDAAKTYNLDPKYIKRVMAKARLDQSVIDAMNHPYEAQPWYLYREHFVSPERIQAGAAFWAKHAKELKRAEKTYGVPASIIVAIIGIESNYGKQRGKYSVLNTLTTLAFEYPARSVFFKKELAEFLALSHEEKIDPAQLKGSYAGALGQPQFMPSSYRHYAVDFGKDNKIDLFNNTGDIIGSIANYLHENGWQANQPIADTADIKNKDNQGLANAERKTLYTVGELGQRGVWIATAYPADLSVNLLSLEKTEQQLAYWLGFHNFYVITRYNGSLLYAMAAYQLSDQIASLRQQQLAEADHKKPKKEKVS
jgi:membrane-bound lytic murein transglycosylase B